MKNLQVTWKGISPLIMHNCQCVNPLHPITKEMKKYTSKRKKTDEEYNILSNLEWEAGAYWKDGLDYIYQQKMLKQRSVMVQK